VCSGTFVRRMGSEFSRNLRSVEWPRVQDLLTCAFLLVLYSPVKSETAAYPGKVIMKMGMFPRIPKPEAQGFGMHRQSWEGKHDGIPVYELKWAGPEKKQMA
jgi:hypothetical protein